MNTIKRGMSTGAWVFFAMLGGAVLAMVALLRGKFAWAFRRGLVTVGAATTARIWSRKYPGPIKVTREDFPIQITPLMVPT